MRRGIPKSVASRGHNTHPRSEHTNRPVSYTHLDVYKRQELRAKARFVRISNAGLLESHPHGVLVTKEAPNYQARR